MLAWIYEHRSELERPLADVAQVWADFGYPDEILGFIHYMSSDSDYEPGAHTRAENEARLIARWKEYLDSVVEPPIEVLGFTPELLAQHPVWKWNDSMDRWCPASATELLPKNQGTLFVSARFTSSRCATGGAIAMRAGLPTSGAGRTSVVKAP